MKYAILGKDIYTPEKISGETTILVEDGLIQKIGAESCNDYKVIDLRDYKVIPGLVDIHMHGVNGFDTMDATHESISEMSRHLATLGVTSFLATTVTAPLNRLEAALKNIAECCSFENGGAKLLGAYVEGPYINREYKGAHPEPCIREIELDEIQGLIEKAQGTIRVITIAPEKPDALEAIRLLTGKGIKVSLGHTAATYKQTKEAIKNGASIVTHLFNGMKALNHREPGIVGAALTDDNANVEVICDMIHLEAPILNIIKKCKDPGSIILISDCIMAAGLKDGQYRLGELDIFVEKGTSRLKDGTLAGSTLKLSDAVANMSMHANISYEQALAMATINPARAIGFGDGIGSIQKGKQADITALDSFNQPVFTMISGRIAFDKTGTNGRINV